MNKCKYYIDFFELIEYIVKCKVLKKYPHILNFIVRAYYSNDERVISVMNDRILKESPVNLHIYLENIDKSKFKTNADINIQPYVALGKEATKRSHSVVICTGESFKEFIKDNGIEYAKADLDLMELLKTKDGQEVFNNGTKHIIKAIYHLCLLYIQ